MRSKPQPGFRPVESNPVLITFASAVHWHDQLLGRFSRAVLRYLKGSNDRRAADSFVMAAEMFQEDLQTLIDQTESSDKRRDMLTMSDEIDKLSNHLLQLRDSMMMVVHNKNKKKRRVAIV